MNRRKFDELKTTTRRLEALLEILLLTFAYYFIWRSCYSSSIFPTYYGGGRYVLMGVYAILTIILFHYCDSTKFGYLKLTDVLVSQWICMVLVNFITYLQLCLIANHMISVLPVLLIMLADLLITFICTFIFTAVYHRFYMPRNMIMIYGNGHAMDLKEKMDTRADKYRITKCISIEQPFEQLCQELHQYDAVVINDVAAPIRNDLLKYCYQNEIRTYITPKLTDILVKGASDISLFDTPLLLVKSRGLTIIQRFFKRLMDIVICLPVMLITSPLMLIIAIAIKIEDRGPVFFKQTRATIYNKKFDILKFRSMIVDAEKEGKSIPATANDPRITKVGKIIRPIRLDELPQIFNILKGDMSIVGPRPERIEHVEKYTREVPEFAYRAKVKGGLTGYAQIYGKYNTSAYDKLRLDLMYIEKYSLMLDIKLMLMTLRIMLKKESTEGFEKQETPVESIAK